jgi:hypothetical protein
MRFIITADPLRRCCRCFLEHRQHGNKPTQQPLLDLHSVNLRCNAFAALGSRKEANDAFKAYVPRNVYVTSMPKVMSCVLIYPHIENGKIGSKFDDRQADHTSMLSNVFSTLFARSADDVYMAVATMRPSVQIAAVSTTKSTVIAPSSSRKNAEILSNMVRTAL